MDKIVCEIMDLLHIKKSIIKYENKLDDEKRKTDY